MSVVDFSKLYPDNRQEGETVLRQAQLVMLRMLKIIDYICRKHDISYWMCSGTLLGAVRHKGFIPWDDDLDICMIREDYERFVEIAVNEFDEECEKGLFIDIFPMDRYHKQKLPFMFEKMVKVYNTFICKSLDAIYFKDESIDKKILAFFHPVFHKLVLQYMKFAKKLIDKNRGLGTDCRLGHGFDTLWKRYLRFDDIFPVVEIDFEDSKFFAPHRPDVYLTTLYGPNYMTPPPEKQRLAAQHAHEIKPII